MIFILWFVSRCASNCASNCASSCASSQLPAFLKNRFWKQAIHLGSLAGFSSWISSRNSVNQVVSTPCSTQRLPWPFQSQGFHECTKRISHRCVSVEQGDLCESPCKKLWRSVCKILERRACDNVETKYLQHVTMRATGKRKSRRYCPPASKN